MDTVSEMLFTVNRYYRYFCARNAKPALLHYVIGPVAFLFCSFWPHRSQLRKWGSRNIYKMRLMRVVCMLAINIRSDRIHRVSKNVSTYFLLCVCRESLNSHKHDKQLLSNYRNTCSKSHRLYIICSKYPPPART